jgi:hypothetical protein
MSTWQQPAARSLHSGIVAPRKYVARRAIAFPESRFESARHQRIAETTMVRIKTTLLALMLTAYPTAALASTEWGQLKWISVRSTDGLVYFGLQVPTYPPGAYPPRTPKPACATEGYWILGDVSQPAVRLQYDLLMRSMQIGKPLRVDGTGTCAGWPDAEDVETVQFG